DWCWNMHPFQVTEETKSMVLDNICHLLNNFLHCSAYKNVIFCWVMHRQEILDEILSALDTKGYAVHRISLVCEEKALIRRLRGDVERGIREENAVQRSLAYLPLYQNLNTRKIDTSARDASEVAEEILRRQDA
ncbi:MAG TPA: nucleotide kinase, partial [Candidatus Pullichristensenella excrementigallinarum]|nr:nucleotide kinase [Candidatus Pullichristensenella excrementigallinarum]